MTEIGRSQFPAAAIWVGFTCLLMFAGGLVHADADENGYAVLVEQSPIHAGTVDPGMGVHKMEIGSTMTLIAVPKPGYRFLYWLGSVSDPSSMATQVKIDGPKIVVAVYERDEFELPLTEMDEGPLSGSPFGGARRTPLALGAGGSLMAAPIEYTYSPYVFDIPDQPDKKLNDPFPVPDVPETDFPVPGENPIPEPTTLCLLAAGSVLLRFKRVSG